MKVKEENTAKKKLRALVKLRLEWKLQEGGAETYVKNKIKEAFRVSGDVDANRIIVSVHDGAAELWGSVRTWAEIHEAERISRSVPGVSSVNAHLYIAR